MNESHIVHFIRQHLNRSARSIPDGVVARLSSVRRDALAHQKRSMRRAVLAAVGARIGLDDLPHVFAALVAALVISVAGASFWHAQEYIAGLEEVDSAILTDDLPLGAFVDKGFDAWLRSSAER